MVFTTSPPAIVPLLVRPVMDMAQSQGNSGGIDFTTFDVPLASKPGRLTSWSESHKELIDLPTEMHDAIFERMDFYDSVSLSLTNRYLYAVGIRHVKLAVARSMGPWAGEPIVCIGEHAEDLPGGLFTEQEMSELNLVHDTEDATQDESTGDEALSSSGGITTLYNLARQTYTSVTGASNVPRLTEHKRFEDLLRELVWEPAVVTPKYLFRLRFIEPRQFYPKHPILRNLDTKEFVREEPLGVLGLGDAVCSRIFWSTAPSFFLHYDRGIHRGVWAGHRFDVVNADAVEGKRKDDWKDVTDSVMKELDAIWSSELGVGWREQVPRWRSGWQRAQAQ